MTWSNTEPDQTSWIPRAPATACEAIAGVLRDWLYLKEPRSSKNREKSRGNNEYQHVRFQILSPLKMPKIITIGHDLNHGIKLDMAKRLTGDSMPSRRARNPISSSLPHRS